MPSQTNTVDPGFAIVSRPKTAAYLQLLDSWETQVKYLALSVSPVKDLEPKGLYL
jgi:hypothetical protein